MNYSVEFSPRNNNPIHPKDTKPGNMYMNLGNNGKTYLFYRSYNALVCINCLNVGEYREENLQYESGWKVRELAPGETINIVGV